MKMKEGEMHASLRLEGRLGRCRLYGVMFDWSRHWAGEHGQGGTNALDRVGAAGQKPGHSTILTKTQWVQWSSGMQKSPGDIHQQRQWLSIHGRAGHFGTERANPDTEKQIFLFLLHLFSVEGRSEILFKRSWTEKRQSDLFLPKEEKSRKSQPWISAVTVFFNLGIWFTCRHNICFWVTMFPTISEQERCLSGQSGLFPPYFWSVPTNEGPIRG